MIFRPNVEFYIPAREEMSDNTDSWLRPTMYWNDEVLFDGVNPVSIKYPNHAKKGTVMVIVNGVTEDSSLVSATIKYKIK